MSDHAPGVVDAIKEALNVHRWKSMGVGTVECECGAILAGDADPFPADDAFREHIAHVVLDAMPPLRVVLGDPETPAPHTTATSQHLVVLPDVAPRYAAVLPDKGQVVRVIAHQVLRNSPFGETADSIIALWPGKTEREVAEEWASYFENHDATVGTEPLTTERIVQLLRGPQPFGVAVGAQVGGES